MMSPDQEKAFEALKHGKGNLFLTGQPGTGKTWLLNEYNDWCIENGKYPARTAYTGIAALHIHGGTLHSWAGVRSENVTGEDIKNICKSYRAVDRYKTTNTLIIDEISMVSAKLLGIIDALAKEIRKSALPFGGIRVIAVGDFFQLPPIEKRSQFAFESPLFESFEIHYLTTQHRQDEKVFNDILSGIRAGFLTEEQKQLIRNRYVEDVSGLEHVIRLDTHNDRIDEINDFKLDRIDAVPITYVMAVSGDEEGEIESLKRYCLSPERLTLKIGAQVLFTQNDRDKQWVNGTMGEVVEMDDHGVKVRLFTHGNIVAVGKVKWEKATGYGKSKKVLATISQLPLKLAWAITIHKSQGMTLDAAVIDVSRVFACGHAYVAISRVRSLDKVYLQGFLNSKFLDVDPKVAAFDKTILPA